MGESVILTADETNSIISEIDLELNSLGEPTTALQHMQSSALHSLKVELGGLSKILGVQKHKLVLIGQVAVGKTTAICHLIGLTAEREKQTKNRRGKETKSRVTEDLMATGSGFTTLCEVVIVSGERTKFEIDPFPRDEVENTVRDFCLSIWKKVYPDENSNAETVSEVNFPAELVRAIRNMVDLPEKSGEDTAISCAENFKRREFEEFTEAVLQRANMVDRIQTTFECEHDEIRKITTWIKTTFDDLNLARLKTVSMPRRINLTVDERILTTQMRDVDAIIDTKGVDAGQFNRSDLDQYIRDDDAAICVLAEGFDTVPTNAMPVLQRHVTSENPLSQSKFILMVLTRGNQPEKVVGANGPVGDRDDGIKLRTSQIKDTLASRGFEGLEPVFFDALYHYEVAGVDVIRRGDSEEGEIVADRDDVWNAFTDSIRARRILISKRVAEIRASLLRIKEGKGLNPEEEEIVKKTKSKVHEYAKSGVPNADRFLEYFRKLWEGSGARHVMTLRATNNRFGIYPPRNIDIYYDTRPITEELVRSALSRPKNEVLEIVRNVREARPNDSDLRELFSVLEQQIDSSFDEMVRHVGTQMHDYVHDEALAPVDDTNDFWTGVQGRFGKGSGYRDDVLSMYADELEECENQLIKNAQEAWRAYVIQPALDFLG